MQDPRNGYPSQPWLIVVTSDMDNMDIKNNKAKKERNKTNKIAKKTPKN